MYLYPLDKSSSITLSNRSNFNLFSLSCEHSREGIIQNLLTDNLINKKTSIVLVPTLEQALYLKQLLAVIDLDSLSLIINNTKEIDEKDLAILRSAAKTTNEDHKVTQFEILENNIQNALQNLEESYGLLNKKIFGERSWRMLSSQKEHFHFHNEVNLVKRKIDVEKINFTQKEYWNIRGRIEEASNTYVNKFSILHKVDCLSPSIYKADNLDEKIVILEKLFNRGNGLLMAFGKLLETISSEIKQEGLEELEQLSAMHAAVNHSLVEYRKKSEIQQTETGITGKIKDVFSSKSDNKEFKALCQQVKFMHDEFAEAKYFELHITAKDINRLTEIDIKEITENAASALSNWEKQIRTYTDTKLKQLSPLNSEHQELRQLAISLSEFLSDLNTAKILKENIEDNTFSLYKKLDLLESTLDKMRTGFTILVDNEDYIEWQSMLAYCKVSTSQIIKGLIGLPTKNWTRIFDQIFISDLLERNQSPRLPKNEVQLEHIDDQATKYRALIKDAIRSKWSIEKRKKLSELKKENKELHNTLIKKNNALELSLTKIITQAPEVLSAMFPIIIVTESAISKVKPLYYKWSECISYNWSQLNSAGSIQIKSYSLKQTVIEESELTENHEKSVRSYFNSNHMDGVTIVGDQLGKIAKSFSQMDNAEKLTTARALSKTMLAANPNLRLFYLRNSCLISTLSDRENSRIVELLSDTGIKEVGHSYDLEETMIDMFVDTSKQCTVLTEDGLLNTSDIVIFDWQYHVVKNLKTLGCQVINMWTANMEDSLARLVDTLNPLLPAKDLDQTTKSLNPSLV